MPTISCFTIYIQYMMLTSSLLDDTSPLPLVISPISKYNIISCIVFAFPFLLHFFYLLILYIYTEHSSTQLLVEVQCLGTSPHLETTSSLEPTYLLTTLPHPLPTTLLIINIILNLLQLLLIIISTICHLQYLH